VVPAGPPRTLGAEHRGLDECDPQRQRTVLLTLVDELGHRLRSEDQVARTLTLTFRFADRSTTTRTRTLTEATGHTRTLLATAYRVHASLGLERARVRSITVTVTGLHAAELATRQLSFDPAEEGGRHIEAAADAVRNRFGRHAVVW
jgi:DNA polymerase-4